MAVMLLWTGNDYEHGGVDGVTSIGPRRPSGYHIDSKWVSFVGAEPGKPRQGCGFASRPWWVWPLSGFRAWAGIFFPESNLKASAPSGMDSRHREVSRWRLSFPKHLARACSLYE